jgi:CDGSH-type Zn-finger protein
MPTKPTIAARQPAVIDLQPGTHYWCRCGLAQKQPFCDGSHRTTDLTPLAFELQQPKKVALCQCKHSANPPYCDGAHGKL